MSETRPEPSMEEILASIKRVIADDSAAALREPRAKIARNGNLAAVPLRPESPPELESIAPAPAPAPPPPAPAPRASRPRPAVAEAPAPPRERAPEAEVFELTEPAPASAEGVELISRDAAAASLRALEALSALVVKPAAGSDNTLDGLVREMLRPMLKEWLDARLPGLVEGLVQREIARITGRSL